MNLEQELNRIASIYRAQGYQVIVRPKPADLPPFAKDFKEFPALGHAYQLRSQIAHGFASPTFDPAVIQLLIDTARRLLAESQPAKRTA